MSTHAKFRKAPYMTIHAPKVGEPTKPLCGTKGTQHNVAPFDEIATVDCKRCSRLLDHNTMQGTPRPKGEPAALASTASHAMPSKEPGTPGARINARSFRVRVTRIERYESTEGKPLSRVVVIFNGSEKAFDIARRTMLILLTDCIERTFARPPAMREGFAAWRNEGFSPIDTRASLA